MGSRKRLILFHGPTVKRWVVQFRIVGERHVTLLNGYPLQRLDRGFINSLSCQSHEWVSLIRVDRLFVDYGLHLSDFESWASSNDLDYIRTTYEKDRALVW